MALWAIGDLHLDFSTDKPMEVFDPVWKNHERKIEKYFRKRVRQDDTVVITGDHSWGVICRSVQRIWRLLKRFPAEKYYCGAIMICSGMQRRRLC